MYLLFAGFSKKQPTIAVPTLLFGSLSWRMVKMKGAWQSSFSSCDAWSMGYTIGLGATAFFVAFCMFLPSTVVVACGTIIRRSLGMSLPVMRQMP